MTAGLNNQDVHSFDNDEAVIREQQNMVAAGERIEDTVYVDTFSFDYTEEYELPGTGGQVIYFKRLTEGKKADFQKLTNGDVRIQRNTGDAKMKMDPAAERHELIRQSVCDWTLVQRNHKGEIARVKFDSSALKTWMEKTDPKFVQGLEKAIREKNEWMRSEITVEGIDEQMEELRQRRAALIKDQAKKS